MPPAGEGYGSFAASLTQTRAPAPAPPPRYGAAISGVRPRNLKGAVGLRPVSWSEALGGGESMWLILSPIVTYVVTMEVFAWQSFYYVQQLSLTLLLLGIACCVSYNSVPSSSKAGVKTKFRAVGVACGLLMGATAGWYMHNRQVMMYYASYHGTRYTNVLPVQAASAHADASIIDFASEAYVQLGEHVGYMPVDGSTRYCVAPILGTTQSNDVQFWAVGQDCCDRKGGSYSCDAVGKPGQHSGVRVFNLGTLMTEADHYQDAIRMAASNSELRGAPDAILVRWVMTEDVAAVVQEKYYIAHFYLFCAFVVGSGPLALGSVMASMAFRKWGILV